MIGIGIIQRLLLKLANLLDVNISAPNNNDILIYNSGTGTWNNGAQGGGSSPLTTKGDVYGFSASNARIPIGTDGQVLTADSTQGLGLKWATASGSGTVTTTGSPANGNLTKFTGATSISNGNLSGDVTTSGTLVTTIASSVGLAGSPTTTTQSAGDNTTKISTTAFVTTAVNNAIAGVNPAVAVSAATTAAGNTSAWTYANGVSGVGATFTGPVNTAITIDGFTYNTITTQSLLVKNDTQSPSGAFNGLYTLTAVQTAGTGAIFTRRLDFDMPSDINNTGAIPVVNGTVNGSTSWVVTSTVNTVGTDPITFTQFSLNPTTIITSSPAAGGVLAGTYPNPSAGATMVLNNQANTFTTGIQYLNGATVEEAVFSNGNSGTSKAINLDNGNLQSVTITGAVTLTLTTPTHPGKMTLVVTQDGTGHVYSIGSSIKFPGGTAPSYSTAASKIDVISIIWDGTNFYGMGGIAFA